jgi:hypothetical protein
MTFMRRFLPAAVATISFLGMAALYVTNHRQTSDALLRSVGVSPYEFPFLDTETVLSGVRCLRDGVDVFESNPCDPLHRVYDYSPLWLLLARLPVTRAWTAPAGIVVDVAFILSLLLLPAGRSVRATAVIVAGVLSPPVVFAMERGNNDLVLFTLASIAAALACRTPALRVIGYASALLAGLLKYYPMTLLALTARERPARFAAVLAGAAGIVALFLATMGHDLMRALQVIPVGSWYGDMFGSSTFPGGLAALMEWPDSVAPVLRVGLTVAAFGAGLALGLRPSFGAALDRLTEPERLSLLAGCLLIVGCFFTAQNIGYRATHLVLTLPAITALWHMRAGRVWNVTLIAVMALLWGQAWRQWLFVRERPGTIGFWVVRESLWWITVPVLIAIVFALLARSEMGRWARSKLQAPLSS